jgi:hypothetical protein
MADAIAFASNTIITNKEAKNEHAEKKTFLTSQHCVIFKV